MEEEEGETVEYRGMQVTVWRIPERTDGEQVPLIRSGYVWHYRVRFARPHASLTVEASAPVPKPVAVVVARVAEKLTRQCGDVRDYAAWRMRVVDADDEALVQRTWRRMCQRAEIWPVLLDDRLSAAPDAAN